MAPTWARSASGQTRFVTTHINANNLPSQTGRPQQSQFQATPCNACRRGPLGAPWYCGPRIVPSRSFRASSGNAAMPSHLTPRTFQSIYPLGTETLPLSLAAGLTNPEPQQAPAPPHNP